jgi:hypothetical protein
MKDIEINIQMTSEEIIQRLTECGATKGMIVDVKKRYISILKPRYWHGFGLTNIQLPLILRLRVEGDITSVIGNVQMSPPRIMSLFVALLLYSLICAVFMGQTNLLFMIISIIICWIYLPLAMVVISIFVKRKFRNEQNCVIEFVYLAIQNTH